MHKLSYRGSGRPHHVFDAAQSRSKHRTVGGGLPAMQSTRFVRTIASSFIAGKPPPTEVALFQ
ncbi:hypothetical protein PsyrCH409_20760 [Pseudomonas viridiflava]|nr:hypothetical protein PsyrCH409_20760 [Pseudomonas viridiflava]